MPPVDGRVCAIFQTDDNDRFEVHKVETINISEAKSRFSEYLSRAAGDERFI